MDRLQTKFQNTYRIKSTRLTHYDYSSIGSYFITICTYKRECCLGEIIESKLQSNEFTKICETCWLQLPNHYDNCELDSFVVMPNHVHFIVRIVETGFKPVSTRYSISEIVRGFKTYTAKKINIIRNKQGIPFWQSRYYDHVIRNEEELYKVREYICSNPLNWKGDRNNLKNIA